MTDKVHPSAKPTGNGTAAAANISLPPTKSQLHGPNRPTYRPRAAPPRRRSSNRCCCTLFCWLILILFILIILLGAAGAVLYFLYHPQRPSFTVTSLKLSTFKLSSSSSTLTSKFQLTLSATNPNKKITFFYQPTSVNILTGDMDVGDGVIPSFEHGKENTTVLKIPVARSGEVAADDAVKGSLKSKSALALKVKMETKVEAKMGMFRTPRVGIRVLCDGIQVTLPAGEKPATASAVNSACAVDVRFKFWKWTLG